MKTLHVQTVEQWRDWLEDNQASASEVWLVAYKQHTGVASIGMRSMRHCASVGG